MQKIHHSNLGGRTRLRQTFKIHWHSGAAYMRETMFEWIPIESKAMTPIGYDPEAEIIYVRFHDGKEWWYSACPQNVWDEFRAWRLGG